VLSILTALITGLLALTGTAFTARRSLQTQREIETLKDRLAEEKDERAARRDYEYDARKRLYQECEPLLFQLALLSDSAVGRITNQADMSKHRNLLADGALPLGILALVVARSLSGPGQEALAAATPGLTWASIQLIRPLLIPALYLLYSELWHAELARVQERGGAHVPRAARLPLALTRPLPKYGTWD
jgi:hypothetical protein